MDVAMKIVKSLEDFGLLLLKGIAETIENKTKEQRDILLTALLN